MSNTQQLLPGMAPKDAADFPGFYAPASMQLVKSTLQHFVNDNVADFIYLSGERGTGKSHLLQAVCNLADQSGKMAMYFSLADIRDYPPEEILEATDCIEFLCLDDVDAIAGNKQWEEALFHLFNKRIGVHTPIYFSATLPAKQLDINLPDLQSRLASCLSFQLPIMSDEEKSDFIQCRAEQRGIKVKDNCVSFIIKRSGRSLSELVEMLERLDIESLAAKRKDITIPFVKEVFGW